MAPGSIQSERHIVILRSKFLACFSFLFWDQDAARGRRPHNSPIERWLRLAEGGGRSRESNRVGHIHIVARSSFFAFETNIPIGPAHILEGSTFFSVVATMRSHTAFGRL